MALSPDDLDPPKPKAALKDLAGLSIEDLKTYIADLQTEIARAEAMINQKEAHKKEAAKLFG